MRGVDVGVGVALGVAAFYGLSIASAIWVAVITPTDYLWALAISAVVCCILGLVVAWRAACAVVASGTMLVIAVIGFATGSESYLWVPPFPADLWPLLWHGSRSTGVIGPLVLLGTVATIRLVTQRRTERPTAHK